MVKFVLPALLSYQIQYRWCYLKIILITHFSGTNRPKWNCDWSKLGPFRDRYRKGAVSRGRVSVWAKRVLLRGLSVLLRWFFDLSQSKDSRSMIDNKIERRYIIALPCPTQILCGSVTDSEFFQRLWFLNRQDAGSISSLATPWIPGHVANGFSEIWVKGGVLQVSLKNLKRWRQFFLNS